MKLILWISLILLCLFGLVTIPGIMINIIISGHEMLFLFGAVIGVLIAEFFLIMMPGWCVWQQIRRE